MPFSSNVFINCPFDDDYIPMLRSIIFTVIFLDLEPKISETTSSSNIRIDQIKKLIALSKYGIHDLSRSKPLRRGDLPRFNMPYELGLDIGCQTYGPKKFRDKKILILEADLYHYQKVLSDISGQDIRNHSDDPKTLSKHIRNWISTIFKQKNIPGPTAIWVAYNQFIDDLNENLRNQGYTKRDINGMPYSDFIKFCKDWIDKFNR